MSRKWVYRIEGRPGHRRKVTKTGKVTWERVLTPNARPNVKSVKVLRAIQSQVKQHDQTLMALQTRTYKPVEPLHKAKVGVALYFTGGVRRRDPDNATGLCKGVLDGLVDGRVLADDSSDVIQSLSISIFNCWKGESDYYLVTVEEVG